jgi:hypothetical protein
VAEQPLLWIALDEERRDFLVHAFSDVLAEIEIVVDRRVAERRRRDVPPPGPERRRRQRRAPPDPRLKVLGWISVPRGDR